MCDEQMVLFEEEPVPDVYPSALLSSDRGDMQLRAVEIDGLKGFDLVEIELCPLTILTGPNNSGKSTVLQAIALAFECLRRCLDTERWTLRTTGRAVAEFEFLPVNQPKDLWYKQVWKPARDRERYVRVGLRFSNGFRCTARIRFLYGLLNLGLEGVEPEPDEALLRALASFSPILLPAAPGPGAHEDYVTEAQVHRLLAIREPSRVIRNILLRLQQTGREKEYSFVNSCLQKYFGISLERIAFQPERDVEIRAPIRQNECSLDVISEGSGFNQILQLAAVIAWRKPGLVLLDEPDAHLHSSVQNQLLDFLMGLVSEYNVQVVLATHSRDLIGQAPLQTIVPIDRSRSKLKPLESIDHLLLEYQRQGNITNVELALLYQTKRCVFVEGDSDCRLLPKIAERLGFSLFVGTDQVVLFPFGGVEKMKLLPDLVKLFERLVGTQLRWGVVRDSDSNIPAVKAKHVEKALALKIPVFHLWERYCIENYLLEPAVLAAAVGHKARARSLGTDEITELLEEAVESIETDVWSTYVTTTQAAYRAFELSDNPFNDGAAAAMEYLQGLRTLDQKLAAYPGKRLFGVFVSFLQKEYGVSLRLDDVIAALAPDNAPKDLFRCLEKLKTL